MWLKFVNLEGLITSISDQVPLLYVGHRRQWLLLAICLLSFLLGLSMVTEVGPYSFTLLEITVIFNTYDAIVDLFFSLQGGIYIFLLCDYYAANGIPIMFFAIVESVCIGWVYGQNYNFLKLHQHFSLSTALVVHHSLFRLVP